MAASALRETARKCSARACNPETPAELQQTFNELSSLAKRVATLQEEGRQDPSIPPAVREAMQQATRTITTLRAERDALREEVKRMEGAQSPVQRRVGEMRSLFLASPAPRPSGSPLSLADLRGTSPATERADSALDQLRKELLEMKKELGELRRTLTSGYDGARSSVQHVQELLGDSDRLALRLKYLPEATLRNELRKTREELAKAHQELAQARHPVPTRKVNNNGIWTLGSIADAEQNIRRMGSQALLVRFQELKKRHAALLKRFASSQSPSLRREILQVQDNLTDCENAAWRTEKTRRSAPPRRGR